jgi:hypothetical protein
MIGPRYHLIYCLIQAVTPESPVNARQTAHLLIL